MKRYFIYLILCWLHISKVSAKVRFVGIDPVYKVVTFKNYYTDTQDLAKYTLVYKGDTIPLSKLALLSGSLKCPPKFFAFFSVPGIDYDSGSVGLFDNRYSSKIIPSNFCDFAQWGKPGQAYEYLADSMKFWKAGDCVSGSFSAFNFTGGAGDRGVSFWVSFKKPALNLRFVHINPYLQQIGIKNTGSSNIDLANLYIANDTGCSDSIGRLPFQVLKGKLNLLKNDTIILSGFHIGDTVGSVSLFFNINRYDTVNLIDYVKWGGGHSRFSYLAQQKGIWDTTQFLFIQPNDSFHYIGNLTRIQSGATYWQVYKDTTDTSHIDTTKLDSTAVYPINRASEKVQIQMVDHQLLITNHTAQNMSVMIYDQQGREITGFNAMSGQHFQDMSHYPSGIYYVHVRQGQWQMVQKVGSCKY